MHAPINTDPNADMIVEDLPTGSFILFVSNTFISFFFGFVGFLLTYLLHTSHAAKFGSRAGLGMTLIQYGIVSKSNQYLEDGEDRGFYINSTTGLLEMGPRPISHPVPDLGQNDTSVELVSELQATHDWASLVLMTMGTFIASYLAQLFLIVLQAGCCYCSPLLGSTASSVGRCLFVAPHARLPPLPHHRPLPQKNPPLQIPQVPWSCSPLIIPTSKLMRICYDEDKMAYLIARRRGSSEI